MGMLTLACVGLFVGQAPPVGGSASDTIFFNRRVLNIPLTFQEARRAEIREILLFVSPDQGRNWQQVARVTPDKELVTFTAPADGIYWLRVASVNRQGKQEPDNIRQGPVDQKINIDTLKPLVRITSSGRQQDEVSLNWELQEDAPLWSTFLLEWQPKDSFQWTPIAATPGFTGKASFRPAIPGPVTVRLTLKDQAGNISTASADVAGSGGVTTAIALSPPSGPGPLIPAVIAQGPIADKGPERVDDAFPTRTIPPPLDPAPGQWSPPGPINPGPAAPLDLGANNKSITVSDAVMPTVTPPSPISSAAPVVENRKPMPAVQYINRAEAPLEYELSKVGPSGVGSIDLYWTRDEGRTWEKYADDPAMKGTTKTGRYSRLIELPGDGLYGFSLLVTSLAGRGKQPPRAGDVPQMLIEIDTRAPEAHLLPLVPDPSRPNALLLRWQARDKNLIANPITLEWAERREGPWQTIALNLANSSQHSWALPDSLPYQVYLRIKARDNAGNECIAVTPEPQLVDLSEPEGHLVGISTRP